MQARARKTIRVKHVKCSFAQPEGLLWVLFSTVPMRELTRSVSRTWYSEYHLITDGSMGYNFIGDGDILQRFRRGRQRRHWRKIHKGRDRPKLITIDEEKTEGGRLDMAFMAAIGTRARKGNHRFYHHRKKGRRKKETGRRRRAPSPGSTEQTFTEVMKEKGVRMHTRSMRTGSRPTESGNDPTRL